MNVSEPPPNENCPPEVVAKYLARYLTGGPISDRRLVSDEDGFVTFQARVGDKTGGSKETIPIRLPGAEFVRRWCLHILPKALLSLNFVFGSSAVAIERSS